MIISRRRLLEVMLVAPFAPWKEILEEAAKPKIFYSIPPMSQLELELEWQEYMVRVISEAFQVPRYLLRVRPEFAQTIRQVRANDEICR